MTEIDNKLLIYRDLISYAKYCNTINFRFLTYLFNPEFYNHTKERLYHLIREGSATVEYSRFFTESNKQLFIHALLDAENVFSKL